MGSNDILLIALGAAVLLGGFGFGGLAKPIQPVGDGLGGLIENIGEEGPIGWLLPDWLEDKARTWTGGWQ